MEIKNIFTSYRLFFSFSLSMTCEMVVASLYVYLLVTQRFKLKNNQKQYTLTISHSFSFFTRYMMEQVKRKKTEEKEKRKTLFFKMVGKFHAREKKIVCLFVLLINKLNYLRCLKVFFCMTES